VTPEAALTGYVTRLGDNALVLGQRMIELVAAGPELEEELANANFALDYIGQARMFYTYAGELEGKGRDEDDFAFLRPEHEYRNLLLVEQPNGHFGDTIMRQVLFDACCWMAWSSAATLGWRRSPRAPSRKCAITCGTAASG
jgi:ring-1,2-phenylacetyl-CoA epoxidase subunit PaaC